MWGSDLLFVNSRANDPLNSNADSGPEPAPGTAGTSKVTDFVTKQSFVSFTGMTLIVKGAWEALQSLGDWGDSKVVALVLAALVGVVQLCLALGHPESKLNWSDYPLAIVIAFFNTLVLWSAVLGTGEARDAVT